MAPIVSYENVYASLDGRLLFDGLSLDILEDEVFVLFGPANCGKSLFSRLALRTLFPDAGAVFVDGHDVADYAPHEMPWVRRKIGAVFMNSALISNLTAEENVALPLRYHTRLGEADIQTRVDQLLDFFQALPNKDARPVMMDVVARRKIAVARALILRPRVVFLDEPTVHLGFIAANLLQNALFDFIRSDLWYDEAIFETTGLNPKGTTVFIGTNEPGRYLLHGTRFGMLYNGKLVFIGSTEELMDTRNPYVHQFVSGRSEGPVREY